MTAETPQWLLGARVFDGTSLHTGLAVQVRDGRIAALAPEDVVGAGAIELQGGVLAPGFVDLQVNGGGGLMLNDAPTLEGVARIAAAHAGLGVTALLPTLITDRPEVTKAAIEAVVAAVAADVPGVVGLHLEGPHISVARKGAHEAGLIRPMEAADLALICDAAQRLPAMMVTVAPETVPPAQIAELADAGVVVSLGHSDADYDQVEDAVEAGARCVTHLFNAMSPLSHRAPGLVGAALDLGAVRCGVIADGIHVHPAALGAALRAKRGPERVFLVSDAMAVAGTDLDRFALGGRQILRRDGRLTLADGTLAGADLDLARAVRLVVDAVGWPLDATLAMVTSIPADVIGAGARLGRLAPGRAADMVWLDDGLRLRRVWRDGMAVVTSESE